MLAFDVEHPVTGSNLCFAHSVMPAMATPTVFIIDNDAAVRDALSVSLHMRGFRVLSFDRAGDFLKTRPHERKGCLLVEFDLEDMKGTDLVAHLMTQHIELPTIIMSARLRKPPFVDPLPRGIVGFLQKPFGQDEILTKLRLAISRLV